METNIHYTIVGAFVIALFAAITLGIIWLSSGLTIEHNSEYMVYMQESVSGLSLDAPVEFNGVNVGSVTAIDLDHRNPQLVAVLISIKNTTPVTQGTVATLASRGVTGITYIALKDKSLDLRPLVRLPGEDYPVIKTAPSLFVRLDTALSQVSTNLQKVTEAVQSVLDRENLDSIRETLSNLQEITHGLARDSAKMDRILDNTERASQQLTPFLQSGATTMKLLEMQTLPAAYRLLNELNDVTQNLNQASIIIKQNPSALIRGVNRPKLGPGETCE